MRPIVEIDRRLRRDTDQRSRTEKGGGNAQAGLIFNGLAGQRCGGLGRDRRCRGIHADRHGDGERDRQCATPTTTATPTVSATPTPTTTATPVPLDHFQCYETHRKAMNLAGVSMEDEFGPSTITVKRDKRICAPANKNGEDPDAPTHPGHLVFYTIKQTAPRPIKIPGVVVTNQFGVLVVTVGKADRMLVPTAKSLTNYPGPLLTPLDHFKCYKVKGKFHQSGLDVETQFGPLDLDIKRPTHLCAPASKNGEDPAALAHTQHLMCYQVKGPRPSTQPTIFTSDQFGNDSRTFFGARELCVPSDITVP